MLFQDHLEQETEQEVTKLVREEMKIPLAVSATTRKPRVGEVDAVDYYFLTIAEFEEKIAMTDSIEYATTMENYLWNTKIPR